jgi:hypothetical protein
MLWFLIFLFGLICVPLFLASGLLWLAASIVEALVTCLERSFAGFANGRLIVAALYLIPATAFTWAIGDGIYLACSFVQAVIK